MFHISFTIKNKKQNNHPKNDKKQKITVRFSNHDCSCSNYNYHNIYCKSKQNTWGH
ncbi:MAG: hypothetical protein GWP09_01260 [Nitrospiraceae bacterium]|nr:hypothetical protein [Nitrospiraceae bacterium]